MDVDFASFRETQFHRIEAFLKKTLDSTLLENTKPSSLLEAIHYCVLNGGKRIRPLLVYATGQALGIPLDSLDAPAAAIELIHCYSLIHDDLPAMDNDDLRRGKPTCHKAFDEATAILVGDALQALAFQILSDPQINKVSADQKIQMIHTLATYSGYAGMIGGQALDIAAKNSAFPLDFEVLRTIHLKKTGALIEAGVMLGAFAHSLLLPSNPLLLKLQEFARCIGLAFQIQDDILDITSNTETLGKTVGKDLKQNKLTFPSQLGLSTAKQYAETLYQKALGTIEFLQEQGSCLASLSEFLINRAR